MNSVNLISVDDIKEVTSMSKNIQAELLEPYILIAEEFFVYPVLGDALVTEIKNQLTGNTLTSLNQVLLIQYITPLSAYGAWHEYIPFGAYKSVQKGEVKQSSDNSDNVTLDELTFKRQAIKDKISFFEERLRKYLEDNKASYPLYRSTCSNNNNTYGASIYLGKY